MVNTTGQVTKVKFRYMEPFANHFSFCHVVDVHNHLWHGDEAISLEDTLGTHYWPIIIFAFLLVLLEVNMFLAFCLFVGKNYENMPLLMFQYQLAEALIHNEYLNPQAR